MFLTADIILCHLVGDYFLQSDWMASVKVKSSVPALVHALTYTLPFLFLTLSWKALLVIAATHFLIDRYRLARYVCWAKNFLAPRWIDPPPVSVQTFEAGKWTSSPTQKLRNYPWAECEATGYSNTAKPPWLTVWLLIITDNAMHLICNAAALRWL